MDGRYLIHFAHLKKIKNKIKKFLEGGGGGRGVEHHNKKKNGGWGEDVRT